MKDEARQSEAGGILWLPRLVGDRCDMSHFAVFPTVIYLHLGSVKSYCMCQKTHKIYMVYQEKDAVLFKKAMTIYTTSIKVDSRFGFVAHLAKWCHMHGPFEPKSTGKRGNPPDLGRYRSTSSHSYTFLLTVSLWACQLTAKQQHTKSAANQASRNLFTRSQAQPSLDHEDPPLNHCARVNMHVYIKFWNHHDANLLHGMQFTPVKGGKRSETYSGRQSESLKWFSCCHRSGSETSLRGAFW